MLEEHNEALDDARKVTENRNSYLEVSLRQSQAALEKAQEAAELWKLLVQSMDRPSLKRLISEVVDGQKKEEEEYSKKKAYALTEVNIFDSKAKEAQKRLSTMKMLMNSVVDDAEERRQL